MNSASASRLLREAIESQPSNVPGPFTWVCGCVEYDVYGKDAISLCSYHGGYEDALAAIAARLAPALEMLGDTGDGWPRRVLQARTMLEKIRKDCVNDG